MEGFDWATCHTPPQSAARTRGALRGAAITSRVAVEGYFNAPFLRLHRNGGHAACRLSTQGPKAGGPGGSFKRRIKENVGLKKEQNDSPAADKALIYFKPQFLDEPDN